VDDFAPIAIAEAELTHPIESVPSTDEHGRRFSEARVLVRLHTRPLGMIGIGVQDGGFAPSACARAIWQQLGDRINQHLRNDRLPPIAGIDSDGLAEVEAPPCLKRRGTVLGRAPRASVIVCTRDRPSMLGRALSSLEKLEYPDYETLVIDGSSTTESAELVRTRFPEVTYVRLEGGGLVVGQNRGLAEATGEIVAYTDDDVIADRHWLAEHVAAFDDGSRVACTTGLAVPLELATSAQLWFEESGAFVEGFDRRVIEVASRDRRSLLPYATGRIGAGVSMAWRKSVLRELGGFDLALDACGAHDLAAFYDALCAGYQIVFEPGALVHHEHRHTYEELRRQIYGHAVGLGAYLTRCLVTRPDRALDFTRRVPGGVMYGFHSSSTRNKKKSGDFPSDLTRVEWLGIAMGPWAYVKGRRAVKRMGAFERPP
jgi:GT2 family glycosyltransferase